MSRLVLVAIVIVTGIGAAVWINASRAPQGYPTSGGQTLEPRWNASGEAADAPAN